MSSPDESTDVGVDAPAAEDAEIVVPTEAEVGEPAAAEPAFDEGASGETSDEPSPSVPEADGTEVDDDTPQLADVAAGMVRIERRLAEYDRLITRQSDVASSLHSENQKLKKGELRQAQSSLVLGVVRVIDDIARMAETAEDTSRADLLLIGESLTDALESHGVERVQVDVGAAFEGKVHKISQVLPTADEGLNRTVAAVSRPGFAWVDGTVIRVTDVVVYKFVPGHGSTDTAGTDEVHTDPAADAGDPADPPQ